MSDWKKIVGAVAPGLAGLLGGPLAAGAVSLVAERLLGESSGDPVADERALALAVAGGIPPEMKARLLDIQAELIKADVRKTEVEADVTRAYLQDAADARKNHASSQWVAGLAVFINVASYLCIGGVLWGCFSVLGAHTEIKTDPGTAAMVGSLIGAAVQWLLSNAAQANGFAFGSSPSARENAARVSQAVSAAASRKS